MYNKSQSGKYYQSISQWCLENCHEFWDALAHQTVLKKAKRKHLGSVCVPSITEDKKTTLKEMRPLFHE
jgi:hypothetical protein